MSKFIQKILWEAKVLDYLKDYEPLKDSDKIRVYHGFYDPADAIAVITHGISGQERAKRVYSYESGNNPKGLFVSMDFKAVKRNFSGSGIIIEFETLLSNLEAPVWKGQDSYFTQGQYTKSFASDEERQAEILRKRQKYKDEDPEGKYGKNRISKSERPELADSLFNNAEHQALFIGNLNPNEIKKVWFNEVLYFDNRTNGEWKRYDRKNFLKKFGNQLMKDTKDHSVHKEKQSKLFKPNDNFDINVLKKRAEKSSWSLDDLIELLKDDPFYANSFLYPKQLEQFKKMF
jgi:hypothetical protein